MKDLIFNRTLGHQSFISETHSHPARFNCIVPGLSTLPLFRVYFPSLIIPYFLSRSHTSSSLLSSLSSAMILKRRVIPVSPSSDQITRTHFTNTVQTATNRCQFTLATITPILPTRLLSRRQVYRRQRHTTPRSCFANRSPPRWNYAYLY